ncbi:outer membrane lipoprotein chaperone LolA [Rhizobacter sp. J219]|jgi:outer membrane lipoprotein carrier protein|uniref:outer membrane lipoprotein chaperone LolA n=1 Tax=Rhizobacter sp. J219 TaxID=2898430 RepID=UPI00215096A1|nr:outer membrane lipoprotein chaperone LolA [Rhizobacter sp. J219]MCR5885896.1 outer membrane lipoprotein chaperone LolA [Rhizobacter sp. J219]
MKKILVSTLLMVAAVAAHAQSTVDTLKEFVRDVKTGRAEFTQTVTSPDGAKKKTSSGKFEFSRPNRFRFTYLKPFEQLIVADGQKVWIYDADLNQASSRKFSQALGSTPAALLAGGSLEKDFDLAAQPSKDGLDWVEATPKAKDGSFKSVRVGFKGKTLSAIEVVDAFNQRSLLQFSQFVANEPIKAETFVFTVPKGADVIEQ